MADGERAVTGQGIGDKTVEPWLRGTLTEVDAVRRQVLHALQLAGEDAERWCAEMTSIELHARPCGVASIAFHLRHIVRSLDRLLTYAEARSLSDVQMQALRSEMDDGASIAEVMEEVRMGLTGAGSRVMALEPATFEQSRSVGRAMLPSTVGSLLVHCAEHTQRHTGQLVTTAKIVIATRPSGEIGHQPVTPVTP